MPVFVPKLPPPGHGRNAGISGGAELWKFRSVICRMTNVRGQDRIGGNPEGVVTRLGAPIMSVRAIRGMILVALSVGLGLGGRAAIYQTIPEADPDQFDFEVERPAEPDDPREIE